MIVFSACIHLLQKSIPIRSILLTKCLCRTFSLRAFPICTHHNFTYACRYEFYGYFYYRFPYVVVCLIHFPFDLWVHIVWVDLLALTPLRVRSEDFCMFGDSYLHPAVHQRIRTFQTRVQFHTLSLKLCVSK